LEEYKRRIGRVLEGKKRGIEEEYSIRVQVYVYNIRIMYNKVNQITNLTYLANPHHTYHQHETQTPARI
jgi:hypothetical protein